MHKGVTVRLSTSQQLEQLFTTPLECKFQTRLKRWAVCARLLSTFPATQLEPRHRPRTSPCRVNFPDEWKATCLSSAPPFCGSLFPAAFALCRALNVTRRARAPALGHISLVALMASGWWARSGSQLAHIAGWGHRKDLEIDTRLLHLGGCPKYGEATISKDKY